MPKNRFHPVARHAARDARQVRAAANAADLAPIVKELQASGVTSLRGIAKALNARGIPTVGGSGQWQAGTFAQLLAWLAGRIVRRLAFAS